MFKKLKDFFRGSSKLVVDRSGQPTNEDLQIATGILLLQMAGADEDYAPEEVAIVYQTIGRAFKLDDETAGRILEIADAARGNSEKVTEYFKSLSQHFTTSQRQQIFAMAWKVIVADGQIAKFEQRYAEQVKARLQLTNEEAEKAKLLVQLGKV